MLGVYHTCFGLFAPVVFVLQESYWNSSGSFSLWSNMWFGMNGHNSRLITHTHTHPFNSPLSRTTRVSRYQKGKTNLDFTEARDREWQWHQLGHMQVFTSLQTDNQASTPPLRFLQAGYPSCRPTSRVKALKSFNYVVEI